DEDRCAAIEESAPEGNPFLDNQLIICSTKFLAASEKRTRQALTATWDMLVVDEAHHLEWSTEKVSPEYAVVELLSKVAKGLLLLTASPEQLGVESHFARLRLLDPVRYADYESFKNESLDHKEIANIVEALSTGKPLDSMHLKMLNTIFGEKRIASLSEGADSAKDNLIEDLLDQHGPGRVVFRNTRSAMSGFPRRKAHLAPIRATEEHDLCITRLAKEFKRDLEPSGSDAAQKQIRFISDPRIDWLIETMEKLESEKVLLICRTKEKVLALERALIKRVNFKVGVFHEDLTIVQRDRNAAWFSESGGARILLCSEIGSEGRNFQFAHHLILFDLPFHPELLEQRIGRLDRIGQLEDIHIHVPYLPGSPQEVLVKWYHDGLHAFEENLEGGNKIAKTFGDRVLKTCLSHASADAKQQLEALIADTAQFQQELKATLADGRDRLLEMNSFRPKIADKLVKQIRTEDQDTGLEIYMTRIFEHFGVEMEDLAPRTYLLHTNATNKELFPSIPKGGISITFDRKRALSREEMPFLTWDHPMATDATDLILSSGAGAASYGVLRKNGSPALLLEILFVLETAGKQKINVDRFLPNTLLRVVVDHSGEEVTDEYPTKILNQQLIPSQVDDVIQNETLTETILPNMIKAATELAETLGAAEISKGLQKMNLTLDHEIKRLKTLQIRNKDIRPDEIQTALDEQASLATLIKDARVRLDAIQLIRKDTTKNQSSEHRK
nr:RNA polymerase-associated protein RapA [Bacteroidales bacterium]